MEKQFSQIDVDDRKNLGRVCRDAVRKAKAQLELKLAEDVENSTKKFFRSVRSSTEKTKVCK